MSRARHTAAICFAFVVLAAATARATLPAAGSPPPPGAPTAHDCGRLIVKLKPSIDACLDHLIAQRRALAPAIGATDLERLNRVFGLRKVRPLRRPDARFSSVSARRAAEEQRMTRRATVGSSAPSFASVYVLEFDPEVDLARAARAYARDPAVEYAEPDSEVSVQFTPNDPFLATSGSWGQPYADLWGLAKIHATEAWDASRGAGIVIAVLDTGVDATHEDIAANLWTNPGEIPGNGIDDDGNGYVDDVHGWDFANDDNDPDDDFGHGTHVAGTAAGVANNGVGVAGVAFDSRVMALKGLSAAGSGTISDLAEAIVYAAENGARVINASWGGPGAGSATLEDAIAVANAAGAVFVAAAGNSTKDIDQAPGLLFIPAALRGAIAVGASTHLDQLAFFSNFGLKLDVVAPGGDMQTSPPDFAERSILSLRAAHAVSEMTGDAALLVGPLYLRQAGTSMAAPHAAGAAALVIAQHPEFDAEQVRQALRAGADDLGAPGFDTQFGYGRLNAAGAVAVSAPLAAHIAAPRDLDSFAGAAITVHGSASGPTFVSYGLDYATDADPGTWIAAIGPVATPVSDGDLGSLDISALPDGGLQLRLRATNGSGAVFEDRVHVIVDRFDITAPAAHQRFHDGVIEIRGTIAEADLQRYDVDYHQAGPFAWTTDGVTLTAGGTQPIADGLLATIDTSALPSPVRFEVRVIATTASGSAEQDISDLIFDRDVRAGWPQHVGEGAYAVECRSGPTIVDLDGDGTKEIVAAFNLGSLTPLDGFVHVFEPDGTERPGWPQAVPAVRSPSVADLDGDGLKEIVVPGQYELYAFRHDGTLVPGWPIPLDSLLTGDPSLADLDGDGRPEIIYRDYGRIEARRIDGSSLPGFPFGSSPSLLDPYFAVGDIDGDGSLDIVASEGKNNSYFSLIPRFRTEVIAVDAGGHMKPGWPKPLGSDTTDHFGHKSYDEGTLPALADLDGDGVLDIVDTPHSVAKLRAYKGNGRRVRGSLRTKLPPYRHRHADDRQDPVVPGDLNGDGIPELVVSTDSGELQLFGPPYLATDFLSVISPGGRGGNLPGWPRLFGLLSSIEKRSGAGSVSIGDIDGDGHQDIVLGLSYCDWWPLNPQNCYGLWAFNSDGSLLAGFPKPTWYPAARRPSQPALGDLDGDGKTEIVWVGANGEIIVWNVPGTPGPENYQWPMARQNPAHTGALPIHP